MSRGESLEVHALCTRLAVRHPQANFTLSSAGQTTSAWSALVPGSRTCWSRPGSSLEVRQAGWGKGSEARVSFASTARRSKEREGRSGKTIGQECSGHDAENSLQLSHTSRQAASSSDRQQEAVCRDRLGAPCVKHGRKWLLASVGKRALWSVSVLERGYRCCFATLRSSPQVSSGAQGLSFCGFWLFARFVEMQAGHCRCLRRIAKKKAASRTRGWEKKTCSAPAPVR